MRVLLIAVASAETPIEASYASWQKEFNPAPIFGGGVFPMPSLQHYTYNSKTIEEHNANPNMTWKMGENQFTGLDLYAVGELMMPASIGHSLLSMNFTVDVPPPTVGSVPDADLHPSTSTPAEFDWTHPTGESSPFTEVRQQGMCGSCWAEASVCVLETASVLHGKAPVTKFSVEQIVQCAPNPQHMGGDGGCRGGLPPVAFDYTKEHGLETDKAMPYTCAPYNSCPYAPETMDQQPQCTGTGSDLRIYLDSYAQVPSNNAAALLEALYRKGPVAVVVAANSWQMYSSGITNCKHDTQLDHAVVATGFGEEDGQGYWKIRNSWGPQWGEQGYIRVTRAINGETEFCGQGQMGQVCGGCGILSILFYPTGVRAEQHQATVAV